MRRARVLKVLLDASSNDASTNEEKANDYGHLQGPAAPHVANNNGIEQAVAPNKTPLKTIHESNDDCKILDAWDPMAEDFRSVKNTLVLDPDKEPECVVTGRMMEDVLTVGKYKVCDYYLKYGSCADGIYCDRLHVDPKSRSKISNLQMAYNSSKDRTCLNYEYLSPQELEPSQTTTLLVSVTLAKAPNNFYFIAPYEKMNFSDFNHDEIDFYIERIQQSSTFKTKLHKCHEQLAYLFNHNYRRDNVDDLIYKGQIVACKLKDGFFCRAEVIEEENFAKDIFLFKLFLLDVGIEVELPRESIYDIKARSMTAPPMTINGRLHLKPAAGTLNWSQDALDFFCNYCKGDKYVLCKILNFEERERMYTVDLYDLKDRSSLTSAMISRKLAEKA